MNYTSAELINNIAKTSFRNSEKNYTKLANLGIPTNVEIDLGNNISIGFYPRHGGILKGFFWGERSITRETALAKCELDKIHSFEPYNISFEPRETGLFTEGAISVLQAAELLEVTPGRVMQLIRNETLSAKKVLGRWWVDTKSVEQYQAKRRPAGRPTKD